MIITVLWVYFSYTSSYKQSRSLHRGEELGMTYLDVLGAFMVVIKQVVNIFFVPIFLVVFYGMIPMHIIIMWLIIGMVDGVVLGVSRLFVPTGTQRKDYLTHYRLLPNKSLEFMKRYKRIGRLYRLLVVMLFLVVEVLLIYGIIVISYLPYHELTVILLGVLLPILYMLVVRILEYITNKRQERLLEIELKVNNYLDKVTGDKKEVQENEKI